ncbi:MAG: hypothetical protein QMD03_02645 [Syntrophales bacterium]|nr:hypothetical protein [Syntrophales bacterium]
MDKLAHYLSTHTLAVMAVTFLVFFIAYFLFKKLIKLALLFLLVLLAIGGYFYFKYPEKKVFENMSQIVQKARSQTGTMVEKGKNAYQKGKDIYEKGKKLTRDLFPEKGEETDRQE